MQTWEKIKIVGGTYIQQPRNNITLSGNFINLKRKFLEIHDVRKLYLWKDGYNFGEKEQASRMADKPARLVTLDRA